MAIGRMPGARQEELFIAASAVRALDNPFYAALDKLLRESGFDEFAEETCREFYAERMGRPGLPPGVYFRMLMAGYLEGIGSERGIAWRCGDSISLREFLGYGLAKTPPEHSTLSKTRKRLSLEAHGAVFGWVLERLRESGLLRGKTVGVDSTTLEANAAMRAIVRRDDGTEYDAWLEQLARASGIETPTRQDLAKLDRKRPKKGSNKDWKHPHDPEARITKMKDGRTRLAHKLEVGVDMETGVVAGGDGADDGRRRHRLAAGDAGRDGAAAGGGGSGAEGSGGRQGLPLERDHDGGEGPRAAQLCERAEPGPPEVERQAGRTEGGLRQSPADPGQPGEAAAAAEGREAGADVRAPARERRVAPRPRSRAEGDPKTLAGSRRGLQPRADDARALRLRHPARPAGPRGSGSGPRRRLRTPLCDRCRPNRAHFRPPKPQHRLLPPFRPPLAQQDRAHSPPAVRTIGALADHFFHGLLGKRRGQLVPKR